MHTFKTENHLYTKYVLILPITFWELVVIAKHLSSVEDNNLKGNTFTAPESAMNGEESGFLVQETNPKSWAHALDIIVNFTCCNFK